MVIEVKLWVALGVIAVIVPLFLYLAKLGIDRIVAKVDELIKSNSEFKTELVRQNGELKTLSLRVEDHNVRLNDHGQRIKDLEIDQARNEAKAKKDEKAK